jgi:hypothetical protein
MDVTADLASEFEAPDRITALVRTAEALSAAEIDARARIREQMDAIGARDIAAIRVSAITGGPACAECGHFTVHGRTVMGGWYCRDTETCEARQESDPCAQAWR